MDGLRLKLLTLGILTWLLIGCEEHSKNQANYQEHGKIPHDSVMILDSLVTAFKVRNPDFAKECAKQVLLYAEVTGDHSLLVHANKLMGVSMLTTNMDSSIFYYNQGLRIADSLILRNHLPHLLYCLAVIHQEYNDYKTALALYDSARRIFTFQGDLANLSSAWCAIGNIKHEMDDYSGAKSAYDSALVLAETNQDQKQIGIALANLTRYEEENDVIIQKLKMAIHHLLQMQGNEEEIAGIFINIGYQFFNPDSARYYFNKALEIGKQFGLTEITISAYNSLAYAYLDLGNTEKAESCLRDHAIPIAKADSNKDWLSTLFDSYADVLAEKGRYKEAFQNERLAMELRAEVDQERADNQIRTLSILLELKDKELLIRKQGTKILEKERKNRNITVFLICSIMVAIGLGIFLLILSQRHRLKIQEQKIESAKKIIRMEEQEKERIGKELHDITGQIMLGINEEIGKLTYGDPPQMNKVQKRIQEIGLGIRNISHKMAKPGMRSLTLAELISDLCENYRVTMNMDIQLYLPKECPRVQHEKSLQIFRIVQEILNNAAKYARESIVILRLKYNSKILELEYSDEGQGFDHTEAQKSGIGISTIFERAIFIGGKAILDSVPGAGTFWTIRIPMDDCFD